MITEHYTRRSTPVVAGRLYSLPDEYYSLLTYDPVFNVHLLPTCRRSLLPPMPEFFDRDENGNSKALPKSIKATNQHGAIFQKTVPFVPFVTSTAPLSDVRH